MRFRGNRRAWRSSAVSILSIPCDGKPGVYRLVIGRYLWPSIQRIRVGAADHVDLGRIEVRPPGCPTFP